MRVTTPIGTSESLHTYTLQPRERGTGAAVSVWSSWAEHEGRAGGRQQHGASALVHAYTL